MIFSLTSSPNSLTGPHVSRLSAQHVPKTPHTRTMKAPAGKLSVFAFQPQPQPIPVPVNSPARKPSQPTPVRIPQPASDIKNPPETETSIDLKEMGPLGQAVFKNQPEKVEELLGKLSEKEINQPDARGFTPLAVAVRYGNDFIVSKLLENKKVDLNKRNQDGRTPLILAARYGRSLILRQLLKNPGKLELNAQDKNGYTALDWVTRQNSIDNINTLKAVNAQCNLYKNR